MSDPDVEALLSSRLVEPCYYAERPADRSDCELLGVVSYGPITLCADCDRRRSAVGKGMAARRLPDPGALVVLQRARRASLKAELALSQAVGAARRAGHLWSSLGAVLGTSRRAARQRFGDEAPEPSSPRS